MEIINITEEQRNRLSYTLADLIFSLKKDNKVECVYFSPYIYEESFGKFIEITVVTKSPNDLKRSQIVRMNNIRNNTDNALHSYGVRIHIDTKKAVNEFPDNLFDRVRIQNFDPSIGNDLFNSIILFDRTSEYTAVREKAKLIGVGEHSNLINYENLAQINPPIMEKFESAMEEFERMERDEGALKKLTKSELFKHILRL